MGKAALALQRPIFVCIRVPQPMAEEGLTLGQRSEKGFEAPGKVKLMKESELGPGSARGQKTL